jgi:hypothetical protein
LDTRNDGSSEDTSSSVWTEDETSEEWGANNEASWGDHLSEGSLGGDLNATFIVWIVNSSSLDGFLTGFVVSNDEVHHVISGISDGLHGEGSEEVWEHSTDKETSELGWLKDIDGSISNTGNEGTEKSETDEASRSNSETFTDGGSGVTSGIKSISKISDLGWESRHLSASSSVIGDWSITIDGKGDWKGSKHTESGKTNTVHTGHGETVTNGSSDADNWDDNGDITEGETKDNIWSWTVIASFSKIFGWVVGVVGVVVGDETNDHTGPETEHDATVGGPSVHGKWDFLSTTFESELFWEKENSWDNASSHDDSGGTNLELKDGLHVFDGDGSDVSEENREP